MSQCWWSRSRIPLLPQRHPRQLLGRRPCRHLRRHPPRHPHRHLHRRLAPHSIRSSTTVGRLVPQSFRSRLKMNAAPSNYIFGSNLDMPRFCSLQKIGMRSPLVLGTTTWLWCASTQGLRRHQSPHLRQCLIQGIPLLSHQKNGITFWPCKSRD